MEEVKELVPETKPVPLRIPAPKKEADMETVKNEDVIRPECLRRRSSAQYAFQRFCRIIWRTCQVNGPYDVQVNGETVSSFANIRPESMKYGDTITIDGSRYRFSRQS